MSETRAYIHEVWHNHVYGNNLAPSHKEHHDQVDSYESELRTYRTAAGVLVWLHHLQSSIPIPTVLKRLAPDSLTPQQVDALFTVLKALNEETDT